MKILHVGITENLGGIETYLYKIASNMDLSEHQLDFLTYPDVTPCFYQELRALGCRFQRVTHRRKSFFAFRRDYEALLKREHYDIVHCHLNSLSFTEPISIAIKNHIPVIAHSRNGAMRKSFHSKILHHLHYLTLPRKQITMLAVSDVAGKWMFGKNAPYTVLNNGVDVKKIHYSPEGRQAIRREFGLKEERIIVHTGAFRTQKNHHFLIDVFASLHRLEPETKLLLVGEGSLEAEIRQKVHLRGLSEKVIFAGLRHDIANLLSAGDAFLFPSLYEGFPNALLEAEAAGLPCVAADTITRQVQIKGLCHYLSLKDSAEEWAKLLHRLPLIDKRSLYLGNIRSLELDAESDVRRLESIYRNLIPQR